MYIPYTHAHTRHMGSQQSVSIDASSAQSVRLFRHRCTTRHIANTIIHISPAFHTHVRDAPFLVVLKNLESFAAPVMRLAIAAIVGIAMAACVLSRLGTGCSERER